VAYPEGYGYWSYGAGFTVLLLKALSKAFGQDFGLAAQPGFLQSAYYYQHMAGPTGKSFNYSDASEGTVPQPLLFWFADQLKDPSLLFVERQRLLAPNPGALVKDRMLPLLLLGGGPGNGSSRPPAPAALRWTGGGPNPVALLRTSWTDPDALFVGLKAGSPQVSHGHMDVGSFVFDADGVRWGMDFGAQDYESLESKGVRLWDMGQAAQRWQVFRYGNQAHSTLTVNNELQNVAGYAPLTGHSAAPGFLSATTDLTALYAGALAAARRGVALVEGRYGLVRDELTAGPVPATVRWTLLTPAAVQLLGPRTAELTKDGKTLRLEVAEPANITLKTYSTRGPHDYDAPNPGTTLVGFEVALPAGAKALLTVLLRPGSKGQQAPRSVRPLARWPRTAPPAPAGP